MNWETGRQLLRRLAAAGRDREFYARLWRLALPITIQQFFVAALNLVGSLLVGQLGDVAVAAVGLGNQIFFLFSLLLFGIGSGAAIFMAQYWGRRDIANIRKVQGLAFSLSLAGGGLFTGIMVFFPQVALGIYSRDPAVIALGSEYLRVAGISCLFTTVSYSYAVALRSTGEVRLPMTVGTGALLLNIGLTYGLVFGVAGLPALGVRGAGYALCIARGLDCVTLVSITYWKKLPAAASGREMFSFDRRFVRKVMERIVPVTLNEVLWSLGVAAYNVIYARVGTEAIAAMNIVTVVDSMAFVLFIGLGNACAILVGHEIGAGEMRKAFRHAGLALGLAMGSGVLIGAGVYVFSGQVLAFYKVSPEVLHSARLVLTIISGSLWLRAANMLLFVGIFRSGGDTRFGFILDAGSIWVVGVPLAYLGAFVLHLPVYWVYLFTLADEANKFGLGVYRYLSRKWIHHLARAE